MNIASQLYVVSIPVHSEFKYEQCISNMNIAFLNTTLLNAARRLHCVPESPNTNIALTAQSEPSPVAPDNFVD